MDWSMWLQGDFAVAAFAVLGIGGVALAERVFLGIWRWNAYFVIGMPLYPRLVPIFMKPEGEGATASVRWEVDEGELIARFWADPAQRTAPRGLHGVVRFLPRRDGQIELDVTWSPPWMPFVAMAWLAGIGLARGDGMLSVPLAVLLSGVLYSLYYQTARRAARELRWAWTGSDEPGEVEGTPALAAEGPWDVSPHLRMRNPSQPSGPDRSRRSSPSQETV